MIPAELRESLAGEIAAALHPREQAINVMYAFQRHYGYFSDEALVEAAELLGLTPLELEELATFYDYIYRSPVGKYVIKVCDSTVCWLEGHQRVIDYISARAGVPMGGTSPDGLFTLLPVCCIGYCDRAPAMVVNKRVYGKLTQEKIGRILDKLAHKAEFDESE